MQQDYLLITNKDAPRNHFFDLDWTLYKYDNWNYHGSKLYNIRWSTIDYI